jgi:queuosine precursor transporter
MIYIAMYLVAIVAANLTTAVFGPNMSILNAFLFIGLDLTARDHLHEAWHRRGLIWKMTLLVASGSILSWIVNRNAGQIAVASFLSFALSGLVDALIYSWLFKHKRMIKVNGSNLSSALVDSIAFPALAFGFPIRWDIMLWQFVAKALGGFFWSLVLVRKGKRQ